MANSKTKQELLLEIGELRIRLEEAEETLQAIRCGEVDALVVSDPRGDQVYTLQGADRFYRILLETMEEGTATLGNDGTILYCNRRLATMLKRPLEKVMGSSIEKYLSPADWQALQQLFKDGSSGINRGEFIFKTADGGYLPVLVSSAVLEVGDGQGVCLTASDLTEQKRTEEELCKSRNELELRVQERTGELTRANRALQMEMDGRRQMEEALRESEERYRMLVETAPDSVIVHRNNQFLYANRAALQLYGADTFGQLMSHTIADLLHPDEREPVAERSRMVMDGAKTPLRETRLLRLDGREVPVEATAAPITYQGSRAVQVIIRDITERRRTDEALRRRNEDLTTLLDSVPAYIWFGNDPECRVITGNRAANEMVGIAAGANISQSVVAEGEAPYLKQLKADGTEYRPDELPMQLAVATRQPVREAYIDFRLADGRRVQILGNAAPLFDAAGNIRGSVAAFLDITDRLTAEREVRRSRDELEIRVQERTAELARANKELQDEMAKREKAEQQLRQAQKLEAIGTLSGGIAHDFNNILGPIVINSEMALLDLPKGSPVRNQLNLVLKSALRGKDLVRQMLLFSRKSEKKQEILALTPLIKETFKLLRSSLPATIQMELHLKTESDAAYADPSQVQQVIMNLCTNAAYAMRGTTGSIDISLEGITFGSTDLPETDMQPGDYLVLSVKDTGYGMDEEVRKQVFEPFFTTKPVGEGTGLGLSVVYGIVKTHKGGITVYSEPGKGSIFRVYLPKADTGVSEKAEPPRPIPRGNERILFVDDEEIITHSVRNMLLHLGYKVTALTDSEEALRLFSANPSEFDLVMVDQTMPSITGEDLGKELMRMRPDVPIILCTGYSDLISSEKAVAMGFRGFILKPFTVQEGAELVRRLLDEKEPRH